MVQSSWSAYDGHGTTPCVGGTGGGDFKNADRDNETPRWRPETARATRSRRTGYLPKLRAQLEGIDKRAGRQIYLRRPVLHRRLHAPHRRDRRQGPGRGETVRTHPRSDRPPGHGAGPPRDLRLVRRHVPRKPRRPAGRWSTRPTPPPPSARRSSSRSHWNAVIGEPEERRERQSRWWLGADPLQMRKRERLGQNAGPFFLAPTQPRVILGLCAGELRFDHRGNSLRFPQ